MTYCRNLTSLNPRWINMRDLKPKSQVLSPIAMKIMTLICTRFCERISCSNKFITKRLQKYFNITSPEKYLRFPLVQGLVFLSIHYFKAVRASNYWQPVKLTFNLKEFSVLYTQTQCTCILVSTDLLIHYCYVGTEH